MNVPEADEPTRIGGWMNRCLAILALAFGVGVVSCATSTPMVTLETIGPVTGRGSMRADSPGFLEVFTATESRDSGGITYLPHTSYSVYGTNGARVLGVVNHIGDLDQRPMVVELPAGDYVVHALSDRYGRLAVPVVISSGRLTSVHLEGRGFPASPDAPATNYVHLPDGRIAGRRAAPLATGSSSSGSARGLR